MFKEVLQAIPDIETYPVIALFVFFSFFIGLIIWYLRVDQSKLEAIARQPLEDETSAPAKHPFT